MILPTKFYVYRYLFNYIINYLEKSLTNYLLYFKLINKLVVTYFEIFEIQSIITRKVDAPLKVVFPVVYIEDSRVLSCNLKLNFTTLFRWLNTFKTMDDGDYDGDE